MSVSGWVFGTAVLPPAAVVTEVTNAATPSVSPSAGNVPVTIATNTAGVAALITAGTSTITAVANQAIVATFTVATAGVATITVTANQATAAVGPSAGSASITSTANQAAANVGPPAGVATVTVTANQAAAGVSPSAGAVAETATANQATTTIAPKVGCVVVTALANQAAPSVGPSAGSAPVTATTYSATVLTRTDAMAECAYVTIAGKDAPMVVQNVWSEGTGTAAVAFSRVGDYVDWLMVIEWMDELQEMDGSLRYMARPDSLNNLVDYKSVIGAAWNIIAHLETPTQSGTQSGMWGETAPYCVPVPI